MKIEFKELPNNSFTDMGISSDIVKSIVVNDIPVGIVYLSDVMDDGMYIEWIEFLSVFRGKHLLRSVMGELYKLYGKLYFESCDELLKKYRAIGAIEGTRDEDREMTDFTFAA